MKWIICIGIMICSFSLSAQDDSVDSWWKKLFKKETVDEIDETQPSDSIDSTETVVTPIESLEIDTTANDFFSNSKMGKINVFSNARIDSLGTIVKEYPLEGYRIQIFFGDLKTAKLERAKYISLKTETPCYLEQTAPNFAVRIGDYRKEYEAYGELMKIKESYPFAHIVATDIEFPALSQ